MYVGHIGSSPTLFRAVPSEQKPIKFSEKVAVGVVRESRKFSEHPCFLRLLNLSKVHTWDWNYYVWVCSPQWVSPKQLAVTLNDLEWPFCVTVLAFCRQNCHRHKCTAETLVTGRGECFMELLFICLNTFDFLNCQPLTAVYRLQTTEFAAW